MSIGIGIYKHIVTLRRLSNMADSRHFYRHHNVAISITLSPFQTSEQQGDHIVFKDPHRQTLEGKRNRI